MKCKNYHLRWLFYAFLVIGVANLFINARSIITGAVLAITGLRSLQPRLLIGGLLQSAFDIFLPVFLISGGLSELLLPKLILKQGSVEIRDQWFPFRKVWAWDELYGVDFHPRVGKQEAFLEFRKTRYSKRKVYLSAFQVKDVVTFLIDSAPREKLMIGFQDVARGEATQDHARPEEP